MVAWRRAWNSMFLTRTLGSRAAVVQYFANLFVAKKKSGLSQPRDKPE